MTKKVKLKKPTAAKIAAELKTLKDQRNKVRRYSMFGDDNQAAIDAQIRVIEEDLIDGDIYDEWEDCDHVRDSALEARNWLDAQGADESPSEGWKPLCN